MPIRPVKIPQNVNVEDRIIGPLTLRQIIITAIGGGISYAVWSLISEAYGSVSIPLGIVSALPVLLAAAIAFVRIHDLSIIRIAFLVAEQSQKPSRRTFGPRRGIHINITSLGRSGPAVQDTETVKHTYNPDDSLTELSSMLDTSTLAPGSTPSASIDGISPKPQTSVVRDISPQS